MLVLYIIYFLYIDNQQLTQQELDLYFPLERNDVDIACESLSWEPVTTKHDGITLQVIHESRLGKAASKGMLIFLVCSSFVVF
jgi:hypothetical protein